MATSVVMPALEMAQETGKLLAWRKKEGDQVTRGEPLLEIETDKVVLEVVTKDLLLAILSKQVTTSQQAAAWFDANPPHQ